MLALEHESNQINRQRIPWGILTLLWALDWSSPGRQWRQAVVASVLIATCGGAVGIGCPNGSWGSWGGFVGAALRPGGLRG